MKLKYVFKKASDVKASERKELRHLRIRDIGIMWDTFKFRRLKKDSNVVLALDEDINKIVGWSFMYPRDGRTEFYVYVKKSYRRNKIGSNIYKTARKKLKVLHADLICHRHDNTSSFFFDKLRGER